MKILYVMRGISGSGKTTYVEKVLVKKHPRLAHISQDHFWIDAYGDYKIDTARMGEAVNWAFHKFLNALESDIPAIVVDNVNACFWHYSLYVRLAKQNGFEVQVIQMPTISKEVALKRNVHDVPEYVINRQIANFKKETEHPVLFVSQNWQDSLDKSDFHELEYYNFNEMEDKIYKMYDICKELANVEVIPGCDEHLARLKEESIQVMKKIKNDPQLKVEYSW